MAVVGGGPKPIDQPNKVFLWDDLLGDYVAEIRLNEPVRNVRLRRDRVFVVLEHAVFVYPLRPVAMLPPLAVVVTAPNPLGMLGLSVDDDHVIFACPAEALGGVYVENSLAGTSRVIDAHSDMASLGALCLSEDGSMLATTDVYGYTVRIFDTATGVKLAEYQRGRAATTVRALRFSPDSMWLSLTSSRPTVHIFKAPPRQPSTVTAALAPAEAAPLMSATTTTATTTTAVTTGVTSSPNPSIRKLEATSASGSSYSYLGSVAAYFYSQGSFAHVRVDCDSCLLGFCKTPGEVVVLSAAGAYTRYRFDVEKGGDAVRLEEKLFM